MLLCINKRTTSDHFHIGEELSAEAWMRMCRTYGSLSPRWPDEMIVCRERSDDDDVNRQRTTCTCSRVQWEHCESYTFGRRMSAKGCTHSLSLLLASGIVQIYQRDRVRNCAHIVCRLHVKTALIYACTMLRFQSAMVACSSV